MTDETVGRTRWGVFSLVLLPCAVVIAALAFALLNGILAASLAVAKLPVQLKVAKLEGKNLTLYPSSVEPLGAGVEPSARAGIGEATISGLCLGLGADVPGIGQVAVKAITPKDVRASSLLLDAKALTGDLTAHDAVVGQDASAFTIGSAAARGPVGTPGLQAGSVLLDGQVGVRAYSLMAGSLNLSGLDLNVVSGTKEPC